MNSSSSNKLYSDLKFFNFMGMIPNVPIHVRIKPTNACNHRCYYCSYLDYRQSLGKNMNRKDSIPKGKMLEIINDLASMSTRAVTFSGGGEPLYYEHIIDTIEALIKNDIKFAALTNGSLLEGGLADLFMRHGSWVRVSIDGWDRTSYRNYRKIDDFDRVVRNLESFSSDKCHLGLNVVVDSYNSTHVYDLIELGFILGVESVKVSGCVISDSKEVNNGYHAPLFNIVNTQIEMARMKFPHMVIFNAYHKQMNAFDKDYTWCPNIYMQPVIGADLNVYACHDKAYDIDTGLLGSLKEKSFKDVWKSIDREKINPSEHCKHHCVAHKKNQLYHEYTNLDKEHVDFI